MPTFRLLGRADTIYNNLYRYIGMCHTLQSGLSNSKPKEFFYKVFARFAFQFSSLCDSCVSSDTTYKLKDSAQSITAAKINNATLDPHSSKRAL